MAYYDLYGKHELDGYQSQGPLATISSVYPSLLHEHTKSHLGKFEPDLKLLTETLSVQDPPHFQNIADQVFGSQQKQAQTCLKHLGNLLYERTSLHQQHLRDINHRHSQTLDKLFLAKINSTPDQAKRLSNLEGQLLQLESQQRDEELAFWKDTVELREKIFEGASLYKDSKHRHDIFSDMETENGR